MVAMTALFKRFQQMRHMREKKEGFRRGLATLMRLRQAPEERNVLRVALPKHRSSVPWALILTGGFMADNSMTGAYQLNLPKDLLTEAKPRIRRLRIRIPMPMAKHAPNHQSRSSEQKPTGRQQVRGGIDLLWLSLVGVGIEHEIDE